MDEVINSLPINYKIFVINEIEKINNDINYIFSKTDNCLANAVLIMYKHYKKSNIIINSIYNNDYTKKFVNNKIRSSNEYKNWRNNVFERDNYTCQKCFNVGGKLNAHHIKHFSKHIELRFNVNNGITLCLNCHKEIHRNNGKH